MIGVKEQLREAMLLNTVLRMKYEVINLIDQGVVPKTVSSFSELHDYIDANTLGGFCEEGVVDALTGFFGGLDTFEGMPADMVSFMNEAQDTLGQWLATREV